MPINTDTLDLKQPLAGQDIQSEPGVANPVLSKERAAQIGALFRQARQDPTAAPDEAPAPAPKETPAEPAPKSMVRGKKVTDPPETGETVHPHAIKDDETSKSEINLDPATLLSPRSRELFKKLEQSRDSYRKQFEETQKALTETTSKLTPLEQEVAKLRGTAPGDIEEIRSAAAKAAQLEEENKRLLAKVETIDFERSDRFQGWWREETGKNIEIAKSAVPAEHREAIAKLIMQEPSAERSAAMAKITEGLDESSKMLLSGALKDITLAKIQRQRALDENAGSLAKLKAQEEKERQEASRQEARRRDEITQAALNRAKELNAFKPIENDADHNAQIPVRESFIRAAVAGQLPEDVAVSIPGLAFEAIHYRDKVVPGLNAEIAKLNSLIKQLQASGPAPSAGAPQKSSSEVKPGAQGGFLAKYKQVTQQG